MNFHADQKNKSRAHTHHAPDSAASPVEPQYLPAVQIVHVVMRSDGHIWPSGHAIAALRPAVQYDPAGHGFCVAAADDGPQKWPSWHEPEIAPRPPTQNEAAGHGVGALEPVGQYVPASHACGLLTVELAGQ